MAFDNNKIFATTSPPPFEVDQPEIMRVLEIKAMDPMTVVIRLTSARYIPTVQSSLNEVLLDFDMKERGNEIKVSAYPPREDFGEDNVLAIVQQHDRGAVRIQNP